MTRKIAVVLAAGKGTRMKSELPKVLIEILGRPMIEYVLDSLAQVGFDQVAVVVGYRAEDVKKALSGRPNLTFVLQEQQNGTGHAVMMCRALLAQHDGPVAVVTGDAPLLQAESLGKLLAEYERRRPACIIGTIHKQNPHGLGRIVRDAAGEFLAIVEEKDATPEQRQLTEVNMSCYVFDSRALLAALEELRPDNAQGEYYITDCPGLMKRDGKLVLALPVLKPIEALGVNTMDELHIVEQSIRDGLDKQ
ncbi:MAG TPA: NTP transferase domain-containing protein [Pirellulales bacterium]|nr:NTP transferase domain-containing protein [Lacipirellulaceae bacterium]HVU87204.1 NTP transferase domain-containing protein [Pirellulales bacterium]